MDLSLRDSVAVREDVMFRQLDDEAVLLDLKSGTYFGLNDVGARIWQLVVEDGSLARVLEALAREYAEDRGVLERDLLALGQELCDRGLLKVAGR